jgi:hypothetical protein
VKNLRYGGAGEGGGEEGDGGRVRMESEEGEGGGRVRRESEESEDWRAMEGD